MNLLYIILIFLMSLKQFQIVGKLGQGAYSVVYKVKRIVDSQIYALKKVKMNNLSSKEQQNALNQVRILASIRNPYVVAYKQAFIQQKCLCIVMEYSDDGDLYQKILSHQKNKTHFQENTIWKIVIDVLMALNALHEVKIFHRDLKSANVFLNLDGIAKLGDMNVSKIAKNGLLYTQTGTPYYASPEVWNQEPYDSKSDIWSLGCVIYEMATLKPPFQAEDMDGLCKRVCKGQYNKLGDQYSKLLAKIVKQMLQVKPSNRPSTQQLLKTLSPKASQLGITIQLENINQQLLQTIRANKKLHYLTNSLPKSNYQNGFEDQKNNKLGPRYNGITISPNLNHNHLPKLDRVVIKNSVNKVLGDSYKQPELYKKNYDLAKMLKIEGKSKNYHEQYDISGSNKAGVRDIRAELRKIYNVKLSPKKISKKIQLPKLI